jgi:hypothetical protein
MVKMCRPLVNEKELGTRQFLAKNGDASYQPNHSRCLAFRHEPSHFALSSFASLTFRAPFRK